jgi:hypothetical protein
LLKWLLNLTYTAGGLIDRSAEKQKEADATGRNIAGMQGNQFGQAVQQQYSSFAENGTDSAE